MYVLGFGLLYDCVENNTVKLYASRAIFGSVVWRFSAVVVMGKSLLRRSATELQTMTSST